MVGQLLLGELANPLDAAERTQGLLQRDLATAVIAFMGLAIVALAFWVRSSSVSAKDMRDLTRECVAAIERNTASAVTLTQSVNASSTGFREAISELSRALGDLKRPPRRRNTGEVPLGPEPQSQVTQVGPKKGGPDEEG